MLSIVLLTYNRPDLVPDAVASIDAQKIFVPVEKILMVNGGDAKHEVRPDWKIIKLWANLGNIAGQNEAIGRTWFDWVLFVSDDVRLRELHCVETLLALRHGCAQVMPTILNADGSIQSTGADYVWPGIGLNRQKPWSKRETDYVPSICYLIRKQCWRDVGQFDASLPMAGEDVDMGLRLRKLYGNSCLYVAQNAYATHLGNSTLKYTKHDAWRFRQAREQVVKKNFQGLDRWSRLSAMKTLSAVTK